MSKQVHIYGPDFSTFVRTVRMVCEEKSISYSTGLTVDGKNVPSKSDHHLKLHPSGKLPVLIHDGAVICETVAICRYLEQAFPGPDLQPASILERAKHDQWCSLIAGDIDQAIVRKYLLEFAFPKGENGSVRMDKVKAAEPGVDNALKILHNQLANQRFIIGDNFTIADALLIPMLDYLLKIPGGEQLFANYESLRDYLNRVIDRPSFQQGIATAASVN